jgi:hypothetical protein
MTGIGPSCPVGPLHKPWAYPPEPGSLSPPDHPSVDDKLNCGSGEFRGKHAIAPRNEQQIGILGQKQ